MFRIKDGIGDEVLVDDNSTEEELELATQRAKRNKILAETDSKMITDRGFTDSKLNEWKTYRQALRDMVFTNLDNITWPTKPT